MYDSDKIGPSGDPLKVYEMEYDEENEIYKIEDMDWSNVEYVKGRGITRQVFRGMNGLERRLEDSENWKFDYHGDRLFVYTHEKKDGWFVYFDNDEVGVDIGDNKLKTMSEYDLEAWLHCEQADPIERLVEKENQ